MSTYYDLGRVVGQGMPAGGAAGQVLVKQTDADYDSAWQDNQATAGGSAAAIAYDPAASGLAATDVQAALDLLAQQLAVVTIQVSGPPGAAVSLTRGAALYQQTLDASGSATFQAQGGGAYALTARLGDHYLHTAYVSASAEALASVRCPSASLTLRGFAGSQVTLRVAGLAITRTFDESGVVTLSPATVGSYVCSVTHQQASDACSFTLADNESAEKKLYAGCVFANRSAAEISAIAAAGNAAAYWQIGDTQSVVMTYADGSSETLQLQIIGFDHDDLADGSGKAPLTLATAGLPNVRQAMNAGNSTIGGWRASDMRGYMATLYAALPADWQAAVKIVSKSSSAGGSDIAALQTTDDRLWLPAEIEIFGSRNLSKADGEGRQYPLFRDAARRQKRLADGTASIYWLRSAASDAMFCAVGSQGTATAAIASVPRCLAFCFCI